MLACCKEKPTLYSVGVTDAGGNHGVNVDIRQITDETLIRETMTAYNMRITCADGVPMESVPDRFLACGGTKFLGAYDGDEFLGLFIAKPFCHNIEAHSYILPNGYGKRALYAAFAAFEWCKRNMPFTAIVTVIPSVNRFSIRFVEKLGFKEYSRLKDRWAYKGEVCDAVFYGIEREAL